MKHVVLYFGSFNPVHRGHIALAEWVAEHVGCDEVVLVVSPKNPLKADDSLAPELNRFEMAELACARSRFPERIKPSVIEFLLEKPSYTIDTLRYLSRNYGGQMRFSVLLGADLVPQLERWRDYREILDGYPLLVYPRRGFETTQYLDRITLLNEAPLCDFSSTEVRRALEQGDDASAMLTPEVLAYIREKRLWDPVRYAERLTERIGEEPCNAALLVERGSSVFDAVVAGGKSRLRPVLMTSFTTILGMLPLAIGTGAGSETWQPMGIAVIGGLTFSTILTLFIVPVLYSILVNRSQRKEREKLARLSAEHQASKH